MSKVTPDGDAGDNPKAFKHWFSTARVKDLAGRIAQLDRRFDRKAFLAATAPLETLELKARVALIAEALHVALPIPFPEAAALIGKLLPPPFDPTVANGQDVLGWPLAHYVGRYGLGHREAALGALYLITQRFTGEFDVRPYLLAEPAATLATLETWTKDPSEHVRRLVSEGTRTRLPWGIRLQPFIDDPTPVLPLLDALHRDPSPYVRRSVANNLNDLAKDHPALVIDRLARWSKRPGPDHDALAARALRTLVKQGHPDALALLGVASAVDTVALHSFEAAPRASIGDSVPLRATLSNATDEPIKVVIDYAVHFRSPTGVRQPKVFKWKTFVLPASASLTLERKHAFRDVSIRKHHPGQHRVDLLINGVARATADIDLRQA